MTTQRQFSGLYLSVPRPLGGDALVIRVSDEEDADEQGRAEFVRLGYEDDDTVYATLYRIADDGALAWSQAFPISGPEAS